MADCLVILSGGQDSTTALFWAREHYKEVEAISFDYGQAHYRELESAEKVAEMAGAQHDVLDLGTIFGGLGKAASPLVNRALKVPEYEKVEEMPGGVEPTFIPGRNILFLTVAAQYAFTRGIKTLAIGVSQEDYGGYPDCRAEFLNAIQEALSLGLTGKPGRLGIVAPLQLLTKAEIVHLGRALPGCWGALAYTHTCYHGEYPPNPRNHASILRARGFHEAGLPDPLILRAKEDGLLPEDYPDTGFIEEIKPKKKKKRKKAARKKPKKEESEEKSEDEDEPAP
jgi:7-cyano-7-deazaguanine synthase